MLTTGNQLKAARAMIGMEQAELASLIGVNINTIRNMEGSGPGPIAGRSQSVLAVQRMLEREGIEFLNHGQPGVRMSGQIMPRPRLFRRSAISSHRHVVFAYDYNGARRNAFVRYDALWVADDNRALAEFDARKGQILAEVARRVDEGLLETGGSTTIDHLPDLSDDEE